MSNLNYFFRSILNIWSYYEMRIDMKVVLCFCVTIWHGVLSHPPPLYWCCALPICRDKDVVVTGCNSVCLKAPATRPSLVQCLSGIQTGTENAALQLGLRHFTIHYVLVFIRVNV